MGYADLTLDEYAHLTQEDYAHLPLESSGTPDGETTSCPWSTATIGEIQTALATIQADVTAIKSRVNALPTNTYSVPTVSEITTGVWGAGTRTLTSATGGGATASEVWAYATRTLTASPTDTSNLAKSAEITALQTHGDTNWATASGFATPADVQLTTTTETVNVTTQAVDLSSVTALLNKIHALLGDWAVSGTSLTTTSGGYVLTKDTNGKITEVRPS